MVLGRAASLDALWSDLDIDLNASITAIKSKHFCDVLDNIHGEFNEAICPMSIIVI